MADRAGLKLIGFVFASLTAAVMVVAATLVIKVGAGEISVERPALQAAASILIQ
jgi:hypothetical protein